MSSVSSYCISKRYYLMNKCAQLWKYARKVHIESIKNKLGKRKDKRKTPLRPWPPSLLYPNLHLLLDHLNRNSNISLCDSVTQESICFFLLRIWSNFEENALCVKEKSYGEQQQIGWSLGGMQKMLSMGRARYCGAGSLQASLCFPTKQLDAKSNKKLIGFTTSTVIIIVIFMNQFGTV